LENFWIDSVVAATIVVSRLTFSTDRAMGREDISEFSLVVLCGALLIVLVSRTIVACVRPTRSWAALAWTASNLHKFSSDSSSVTITKEQEYKHTWKKEL